MTVGVTPVRGQLKGAAYTATLQFIQVRFGAPARARVLDRLSPEDRALVGGLILPIGWYPLEPFPRLLRALDAELGRGDFSLCVERGTWVAQNDLKTTHKILLKFVTPGWVIAKATSIWKNFHDTGRWVTAADGPKGAYATLYELGVVDEAMCATLKGWIIGLLTTAGCKGLKVKHTGCRLRGAEGCAYHSTWL